MAAAVDYNNTNPTIGIYGVYNEFFAAISATSASKFKHSFRIRVTADNDTSKTYTKDVASVSVSGNFRANVNPVSVMRELFFEGEYTGISEDTATKSYSGLQIEIGET